MLGNQLSLKSLTTKAVFILAAGFSVASYADTCPAKGEIKAAPDEASPGSFYYYTESGWQSPSSPAYGADIQFLYMVGINGDGPANVGCAYRTIENRGVGLRNPNQPAATPVWDAGTLWKDLSYIGVKVCDGGVQSAIDPGSCPFTSLNPPAVDIFSSPFGKKPISKK